MTIAMDVKPSVDPNLLPVFQALPGCSVLLATDAPRFTVLAITDDTEKRTGRSRQQLVGNGLFELFPENPADSGAHGKRQGLAALQLVLDEKVESRLPVLRYDLLDDQGAYTEQYWLVVNRPVFNAEQQVQWIIHTFSNITAEVMAGQMQHQVKSMAQVNNIFMETPIAIAILKGPDFVVELANGPLVEVWGKGPNVTGKPIREVLPEIEGQGFIELMKNVVREDKAFHAYEMPVELFRNGREETVYFNFSYQPYHELPQTAPVGILIFASEVTKEVATRKELALKEKSLELAVEIGELGVYEINVSCTEIENCFATFSTRIGQWFGLERPYALLSEMSAGIYPDDLPGVLAVLKQTLHGGNNGKHNITYRVGQRGSDLRYLRSIGQVRFENGQPQTLSGIIQDVTEQVTATETIRQSEERIKNMVESTPFPIGVYIGRELRIAFANQAMIAIYGKGDEVIGKRYAEILPELTNQKLFEQMDRVYTTGESFFATTQQLNIRVNGEIKTAYFNYSFVPLRDSQGKVYGILNTGADVTDIVLAKQKVEESERTFRSLIEQTPVAIDIMMGPEFVFELVNPPMAELIGRAKEDLLYKPLFEALPEIRNNGLEAILKEVYHTGKRFEAQEFAVPLHRNGLLQKVYVNFIYEPLKNSGNEVIGIIAAAIDVSEQVIARKKIEESEARFENLVRDASAAIIVLTGDEMRVEIANDAYAQLIGRKPGEILNKPLFSIIPEAEAYYRPLLQKVKDTGEPVHLNDSPYSINVDGKTLEGFLHVTYQPYRHADGSVVGVMAILQDVTGQVNARKKLEESEQHLELLSNTVPAMIFYIDDEQRYRSYNNTFMQWFGVDKTEAIGKTVAELVGENAYNRVRPHLEVAYGGQQERYEMQAPQRIGESRWLSIVYTPHKNDEGKVLGIIVHATDVTERKLAQQRIEEEVILRTRELAEANRELKRSNQNLEEFAHAASHDLKEPIRKIHFFTNQLKGQLSSHLSEAEQRSFNRIENATQRMGSLIDDLLLYSHVSQRPHEKEAVDLSQTLQHVLEDLELDIQEKKAVLTIGPLPVVKGYRRQLQQLFQNLLSNALKYSHENQPPVVEISSGMVDEAGTCFHRISVKDNGIGIAPEYREKIFQMFTRLHGKNEYSGTGVGLSIVKKIVENHDGKISIESKADEGSTFLVKIPVE